MHQVGSIPTMIYSYRHWALKTLLLHSFACFGLALFGLVLLPNSNVLGATGTFIDRQQATDLRVVSYNVLWDRIFSDVDVFQADKFSRVLAALDPDILNLQEIGNPFCASCTPKSGEDVRVLLNTLAPLSGNEGWYVHQGSDNVIASKYPLSMQAIDTSPAGNRRQAIALVDLPENQFAADFYFLNNHYKCCGNAGGFEDQLRQQQSDAIVNWIRDARTPGGAVDLAPGTPIAVLGDLNIVGGPDPLDTLIDGDIFDENTYGSDAAPDWDGSSFTDAHPLHNGFGIDSYTWRNDHSSFAPSRLDYVIYSDSALDVGNQFVLNTVAMSPAELTATGLQSLDITVDSTGERYDHLPVVVDFRIFGFDQADFNFDRTVNATDLNVWQSGFGLASGAARSQGDTDADGDIDGRDFLRWQRDFSDIATAQAAIVPEPTALLLCLMFLALTLFLRR